MKKLLLSMLVISLLISMNHLLGTEFFSNFWKSSADAEVQATTKQVETKWAKNNKNELEDIDNRSKFGGKATTAETEQLKKFAQQFHTLRNELDTVYSLIDKIETLENEKKYEEAANLTKAFVKKFNGSPETVLERLEKPYDIARDLYYEERLKLDVAAKEPLRQRPSPPSSTIQKKPWYPF